MFTIDHSENEVLGSAYRRGREEGQLALLRRQIERRFGTLPTWAEQKFSQSTTDELEAATLGYLFC